MDKHRDHFESQLSAYLDDELTPEDRAAVKARLAEDPAARSLLADLELVRGALASLPRGRASSDMMEAIRARMERQALLGETPGPARADRAGISTAGRWVAAAAIVLMTGAGGYVIWNLSTAPPEIMKDNTLAARDSQGLSAKLGLDPAQSQYQGDRGREKLPDGRLGDGLEIAEAGERRGELTRERRGLKAVGELTPAAPAAPARKAAELFDRAPDELAGAVEHARQGGMERLAAKEESEPILADRGKDLDQPARETAPAAKKEDVKTENGGIYGGALEVVTVACADVESRQRLLRELAAEALAVEDLARPADDDTHPAEVPAEPATMTPLRQREEIQASGPRRSAPSSAGLRRPSRAVTSPEPRKLNKPVEGAPPKLEPDVTDLLVVVADDWAREQMLGRLARSETLARFGVATTQAARRQAYYSRSEADGEGVAIAPDKEAPTGGTLDFRYESKANELPADETRRWHTLHSSDALKAEAFSELEGEEGRLALRRNAPAETCQPGGAGRLSKQMAASSTAESDQYADYSGYGGGFGGFGGMSSSGSGPYIVRLHIGVQNGLAQSAASPFGRPATVPAGQAAAASQPAESAQSMPAESAQSMPADTEKLSATHPAR